MSLDFYLTKTLDLGGEEPYVVEIFHANITHNLTDMAHEAGIYGCLWRPEEFDLTQAKQLIEPLTKGLEELEKHPEKYKQYNPENGWGSYEGLVKFVRKVLAACEQYPLADVKAYR